MSQDDTGLPARGDCFVATCPTRKILGHITGRWGSLIIAALRGRETMRFSELRTQIDGVSEKMLSQTLRELDRDGLISRKSFPVVPPHVEYALTPMGRGVAEHIDKLVDWINANAGNMVAAQRSHDAQTSIY
jgi:DNA-binding HxlR family transcriptional regulator